MFKFLFFILVLIIPAALLAEELPVVFFNKNTEIAYKKRNFETKRKRESLTMSVNVDDGTVVKTQISDITLDDIKVKNCRQYEAALSDGYAPLYAEAQRIAGKYYGICNAINILRNAKKPKKDFIEGDLSTLIYERLDTSSFYNTFSLREKKAVKYLRTIVTRNPDKYETFLDLNHIDMYFKGRENWKYEFDILAKSDFNDDGIADLLLAFTEENQVEGGFYSYNLYIISRLEPKADLVVLHDKK